MILKKISLLLLIVSYCYAMEKEPLQSNKHNNNHINYRIIKLYYGAPPSEESSFQYVKALRINDVIIPNNTTQYIPVINNTLYIQPQESQRDLRIGSFINMLLQHKIITISPKQEIVKINPVKLAIAQSGVPKIGSCEDITFNQNNTEKMFKLTVKITNNIQQHKTLFNGTYIPYNKNKLIVVPEGHIIIETVESKAISHATQKGLSPHSQALIPYYHQVLPNKETYLQQLGASIQRKFIQQHIDRTTCTFSFSPDCMPIPLMPNNEQLHDQFNNTYFNRLPNEILHLLSQFIIAHSIRLDISNKAKNKQATEIVVEEHINIPTFEKLTPRDQNQKIYEKY